MHRLDSRAPLVVDTRDLGRRAGAMLEVTRTVSAPAGLGLDVIGVPEASPLELDLRLESVVDGVLVSGSARARLAGECVRCLEPVSSLVDVTFQELYVYPEDPAHGSRRHGSRASTATPADAEDDDGTTWLEDDLIDLEPVVRDAVVLALPFQPVCREDCPGLCPECGILLAGAPGHGHASTDPRWAALQDLIDPQEHAADGRVAEKEES